MERIRNAVRALIMEDDRLLCIKKERPEVGVYYALPGGAHGPNETLERRCGVNARKSWVVSGRP
ncbi:hypothetical protein L5D93_25215 [Paenibacillus thiaminolyticus]|nr:hypothetical protein [Paenibacillus thiaminolyticus]